MSLSRLEWSNAVLPLSSSIEQVIKNLEKSGLKIVLIVNTANVLEGTISDGDIRRNLLKGLQMSGSIISIMNRDSIIVSPEVPKELVIDMMVENKIQQIPIVDENRHIIGLHLWNEIVVPQVRPNQMVIMAGGKGSRLLPHTENCPKPLLKVAGKPILEHIIDRAKVEGFYHFIIAVHYLGDMIKEYFGDGKKFGVKIIYLQEKIPLGTAGALSLLNPKPELPFVVTNGDVITDIRYGELLDFHTNHSAQATMAVRVHEWHHPFGVVQTNGIEIVGFEEKPIAISHINAGIYAFNPISLGVLIANKHCDMPKLFERLKAKKNLTIAYPMHEPWLDVGRPVDLVKANKI